MNRFLPLAALAAVFCLFSPRSDAALISGQMSITGSAVVDASTIDWTPLGTGTGVFTVDPFVGNSGFFTVLAGATGNILDLDLTTAPVNVPNLGIADFMTFASQPNLSFTLDFIAPGPYSAAACGAAPAAGQVCTFPGSPFGLSNPSVNSSGVELVLLGTVSDGSGDPASSWRGTFTTQFDVPYQELLDIVFNQGGSIGNTYSATFTVTAPPGQVIPEPASVLLFGAGLVGVALFRKKRVG